MGKSWFWGRREHGWPLPADASPMPAIHRPRETAELVRRSFGTRPVAVSELLQSGITRKRIRSALSVGTLEQVRRGVVRVPVRELDGPPPEPSSASGFVVDRPDQLRRARAALLRLADDSVVSHGSAAVLQHVPTYHRAPDDVWVTAPRHGRVVAGTHRRLGTVAGPDRTIVDGIPCTSVARTALDLARRRPLHESLVAIDAALARVGRAEIRATIARLDWVYDLPQLSAAVQSGDAASESPLESMSRGWMYETGVPQPLLQQWVTGASGKRYRVDFLWPGSKVIGEADGISKYMTIDDVRAEKRREDDLRRAGYQFERWTYAELMADPMAVMLRIQRALAR